MVLALFSCATLIREIPVEEKIRMRSMKPILALWLVCVGLLACGGGSNPAQDEKAGAAPESATDSAVLRLALLPTVDCLPFYYAEASGIYDTLGLHGLRLVTFAAQADADTAMLGGDVQGGVTDLVRLAYYCGKGKPLVAVAATDGSWAFAACGSLRIRKVDKMKGRMVATSRLSASDCLSGEALQKNKMEYGDIYRPQINDYSLRASMLNGNQIDGAVLPEPYATVARLAGHRLLPATGFSDVRLGCVAFNRKALKDKETAAALKLLLTGYNIAADSLNRRGAAACADLLLNDFHLPRNVVDSLRLPRYSHAHLPEAGDVEKARTFLKERGHAGKRPDASSMLDKAFLP